MRQPLGEEPMKAKPRSASRLGMVVGAASLCLAWAAEPTPARAEDARPNVLFIAIDDFNDWVHHLGGHPQAKTPNIDRLAKRGVTFTRAYCAAPVCNPSRAALMSGKRPSTTGVYDNGQDFQQAIPPTITLTAQFLHAGCLVFGTGKIYHADVHRDTEW